MHKKKERKKPAETKKWKATKLTYEQRKQHLKVGLSDIAALHVVHESKQAMCCACLLLKSLYALSLVCVWCALMLPRSKPSILCVAGALASFAGGSR